VDNFEELRKEMSLMEKKPINIFISYVRENENEVDRLVKDLKSEGFNVWIDRESIKPGTYWEDAIKQGIQEGDIFLACFSKESEEKEETHQREEIILAANKLRKKPYDSGWFIPLKLNECNIPDYPISQDRTLKSIQHIELYKDWDNGIKKIVQAIKPFSKAIQNIHDGYTIKKIEDPTEEISPEVIETISQISEIISKRVHNMINYFGAIQRGNDVYEINKEGQN